MEVPGRGREGDEKGTRRGREGDEKGAKEGGRKRTGQGEQQRWNGPRLRHRKQRPGEAAAWGMAVVPATSVGP